MQRKEHAGLNSVEPDPSYNDEPASEADDDVLAITQRLLSIAKTLVGNFQRRLDEDTEGKILPAIGDLSRLFQLVEDLGTKMPPRVLEVRWIKTIVDPDAKD